MTTSPQPRRGVNSEESEVPMPSGPPYREEHHEVAHREHHHHGGHGAAEGIDPHIAGMLAYFTWVGGLIVFLTQKNRMVRFHAAQSILFSIALLVIYMALWTVTVLLSWMFSGFGFLSFFLFPVLGIASLVLWVILVIKGYKLEHFKLPIIGDIADKWAAR